MISCFAASWHTSSSTIAAPAMFTPMSVGDLYGVVPVTFSSSADSSGNTSTSRL